ncbi:hypothetical protein T484DRAFT_1910042 [Baffinella frigidus]|nr:hypothetical protein T484DRAFT_1910042 [Cryptophyta sp. CCMP2293]
MSVLCDVAKQQRNIRLFPELKVQEEYEDAKSAYSIDIRAERSGAGDASDTGLGAGTVWAVEVDGPTHFLKGGTPSGSTLLKRRYLKRLGYTAVAGEEELRWYFEDKLLIDQVS